MNPVIISRGPSIPVAPDPDRHSEARWLAPVVTLPDDHGVKLACERLLNPLERRRFRALYREAHDRNHEGVRTSIRLALRRMHEEATERVDRAMERAKR